MKDSSSISLVAKRYRTKSETNLTHLQRRTWFGLAKKPKSPKAKKTQAARAHSIPTDIEKLGLSRFGQTARGQSRIQDPVDEFWDEYWSITEQTLSSDLTLAERVSTVTNKREVVRLARSDNNIVGKFSAVNVFLDELLDQYLDKLPSDPVRTTEASSEEKSEDSVETGRAYSMKSNINELLFCSATGPGDRILEKWFVADQKAEEGYHKSISWIKSPVNTKSIGPVHARNIHFLVGVFAFLIYVKRITYWISFLIHKVIGADRKIQ